MAVEVFVARMTEFMEEAELVSWLVAEGEHVDEGQALLELQTDKALAEMPAPASGYLKGIRPGAEPGVMIPVGETLAYIVESLDEPVETLSPL